MSSTKTILGALLVLLASGLLATPARALTLIPPRDLSTLARSSDAVVLVEALDAEVVGRDFLATRTRFRVHRALAGPVQLHETIFVETPGGRADTHAVIVSGVPRFEQGRLYLLCLLARERLWIPRMASYGVLVEDVDLLGRSILRPIAPHHHASVTRPDGVTAEPIGAYAEDALLEHLAAVLDGSQVWSSEAVQLPGASIHAAIPDECAQFAVRTVDGDYFIRWRPFDTGGSISISADSRNDEEIDAIPLLESAIALWNQIPETSIDARYAGTVEVDDDCDSADSFTVRGFRNNTVVFNDPCGSIPDLGPTGGILARGGLRVGLDDGSATLFPHATDTCALWVDAEAWYILVNNGIVRGADLSSASYGRMLAHEIGHGLGFDHVADRSALMFDTCCSNRINSTDRACARFVYPTRLPNIVSGASNVEFGEVRVGEAATASVEISTDGNVELAMSKFSTSGDDPDEFSLIAPPGARIHPCSPSPRLTVEVRYLPTTRRAHSASLRIVSDDPDTPVLSIPLAGRGIAGALETSPPRADFTDVVVGAATEETFALRNVGNAALELSGLSIVGTHRADFSVDQGGDASSLPPGATREVVVRFAPSARGARQAQLRIRSDDPDGASVDVPLAGTGLAADIALSPSSLDFGNVSKRDSRTLPLSIQNVGSAPLEILAIELDAPASASYSLSGMTRFSLPPGASEQIDITFEPTTDGLLAGTLEIRSDAPARARALVQLIGRGGFAPGSLERPGDCNGDSSLDLSDGICLLGFLFQGRPQRLPCGDGTSTHTSNLDLLDGNGDRRLDLSDAVAVFRYLFLGGPEHAAGLECVLLRDCPGRCEN